MTGQASHQVRLGPIRLLIVEANMRYSHWSTSAVLLLYAGLQALGQVSANEDGRQITTKGTATLTLGTGKAKDVNAQTVFKFHPLKTATSTFTTQAGGTGDEVQHIYPSNEEDHHTSGNAVHYLNYTLNRNGKGFFVKDRIIANIVSGDKRGQQVSIQGVLSDPFTFSDGGLNSDFAFVPEGLDYSFSLFSGTSFPDNFVTDPNEPGALTLGTSMVFKGRLAPGVASDTASFWGDLPSGGIDLYTLTLTPDVLDNIDAVLVFGKTNGDFVLDFRNSVGQSFDPNDPFAMNQITSLINSSFSGGTLNTDLNDLFTVGFVPTSNVVSFTLGGQDENNLSGTEVGSVPEPSSLFFLVIGSLLLTPTALKLRLRERLVRRL
jgi:hypothetical protein